VEHVLRRFDLGDLNEQARPAHEGMEWVMRLGGRELSFGQERV
jgi:hypothetical protein